MASHDARVNHFVGMERWVTLSTFLIIPLSIALPCSGYLCDPSFMSASHYGNFWFYFSHPPTPYLLVHINYRVTGVEEVLGEPLASPSPFAQKIWHLTAIFSAQNHYSLPYLSYHLLTGSQWSQATKWHHVTRVWIILWAWNGESPLESFSHYSFLHRVALLRLSLRSFFHVCFSLWKFLILFFPPTHSIFVSPYQL